MTEPTTHILESTEASISSGTIDPRRPPALTIESGDIVSCPNTWTQAHQTGSVYSSIPPRTIHAVIPKSVLGESVVSRIDASMRPAS